MVGFSFVPGEPRRYTATVENALAQSSGLRKTFHMAKSKEISDAINDCLKGIAAFFREHRDEIAVAGRMFLDGSIVNHICQPLADVGWHLNFRSPLRAIVVDDQIDEKMKNHLTLDWEELLNSLTEHFLKEKGLLNEQRKGTWRKITFQAFRFLLLRLMEYVMILSALRISPILAK